MKLFLRYDILRFCGEKSMISEKEFDVLSEIEASKKIIFRKESFRNRLDILWVQSILRLLH